MKTESEPRFLGIGSNLSLVAGLPFHNVTFGQTVETIGTMVQRKQPSYIVTANADFLVSASQNPRHHNILFHADLVVADGMPVLWMAKLLNQPLSDRVTGSDLVPLIAESSEKRGYRVFILGGKEGVPERATAALRKEYPDAALVGSYSPPYAPLEEMNHDEINNRILDCRPDIVLVAFGSPKQEYWIEMWHKELQIPVSIGVGGSIDFLAGEQIRAPKLFQKTGFEWLWRLGSDPKRLARRYGRNAGFLIAEICRIIQFKLRNPELFSPDFRGSGSLTFLESEDGVVCLNFEKIEKMSIFELSNLIRTIRTFEKFSIPYQLENFPSEITDMIEFMRLDKILLTEKSERVQ